MFREHRIEARIMEHPELLCFPDALGVRNVRISPETGRVDIMLLPEHGRTKLVLIEVKHINSTDASSKVVGQLLMYYTAGLQIGTSGLSKIRQFAIDHPRAARSTHNTSLNKIAGGARSQDQAWRVLQGGRKLRPGQIRLFLGLDAEPSNKLVQILRLLKRDHCLPIGVIVANHKGVYLSDAV